jgi:hypothetical protein
MRKIIKCVSYPADRRLFLIQLETELHKEAYVTVKLRLP